ncbi:hypothetical protein SDC9_115466 [bioreactor metagenome]|uniref:Uncharacterized protein n=1 Tax=bioreactor metagenome TaxID=1076179 RepID=A0A645BZJ7_9ZZZZ
MQYAVREQVVEARISPLDDQCRQGRQRAGGALDHVTHDLLKTVRDAIELVAQRGLDTHISADEIAVPAHADTDRAHAGGASHGYRAAATDGVHDLIPDDGAAGLEAGLPPREAADQGERARQHRGAQRAACLGGEVHQFRTLHRRTLSKNRRFRGTPGPGVRSTHTAATAPRRSRLAEPGSGSRCAGRPCRTKTERA